MASSEDKANYSDGSPALKFESDGSGFAFYNMSHRIAVCTTNLNGAISTTMYFDRKDRPVMLNFDAVGVGCCCFPNGRPRLTTTASGGRWFDEKGNMIKTWSWAKGLQSEISFPLSEHVNFTLIDRSKISAGFSCEGRARTFELGLILRRTDTYLTKVISRNRQGHLILDIERVRESLKRSQDIRASQLGAAGQTASMPLPKITPAYISKVNHPDVLKVIETAGEISDRVKSKAFHVDVGTLTEIGEDRRRHALVDTFVAKDHPMYEEARKIRTVQMGGKYLPFKLLTNSYVSSKKTLPNIRAADLDTFLASCPPTQIVMVVVTASWSHESQKAVQVWEQCYGQIFAQESRDPANPKTPEELSMRVVSVDAGESRMWYDRYNLRSVPMFLCFSRSKLVYAKNHMMIDPGHEHKAFAVSCQDAHALLLRCGELVSRGVFLPQDFRFGVTDDEIGDGMTRRLQAVFGRG